MNPKFENKLIFNNLCHKKIRKYSKAIFFDRDGVINEDIHYLTNNPQRRCPDISKAKKLLDFNPEVLVNEGVKNYLYFLFG